MNAVCVLIGIIFLIFVMIGFFQGMFKVILSLAGLIISLAISTYVAPYVSGYIEEHTKVDDNIATYIAEQMKYSDTGQDASRGVQVAVINELPLPETLKSNILDNNNSEMYNVLEVSGVYEYIAKSIAVVILNAAVFLVIMGICRMFLFFLSKGMGGFTKLPIVKSIDKTGGAILGAMKGLIIIWIFFLLLSITSTFEWSQQLIDQIGQSAVLKLLYNNNVLLDIVGDLTRVLFL